MNARIEPRPLRGTLAARASKSVAHRLLILAALARGTTAIALDAASDDIDATARCVAALGARLVRESAGLRVFPIRHGASEEPQGGLTLDVGESGSTLRFLLPVVCALGVRARIVGHGRLAARPLLPLCEELCAHGCSITGRGTLPLETGGMLRSGRFRLPGGVSSQYASGLLMAAPLLDGDVDVLVSEPVESAPYLRLTIDALARFGVHVDVGRVCDGGVAHRRYHVDGASALDSPGVLHVEGDWSNAAFWLAAGALSRAGVGVDGLDLASAQGDRAILAALATFGATVSRGGPRVSASRNVPGGATISLMDTPDLVAPLVAVAASAPGVTRLTDAARLALKESDRLRTMAAAVNALGGQASCTADALLISGRTLSGGTVDAAGDHRVAMAASIAATCATGPSIIVGAECVRKSYPLFFEDFCALGGKVMLED